MCQIKISTSQSHLTILEVKIYVNSFALPLVPYNHTDFSYTPRNTHTQVEYIPPPPFFLIVFSFWAWFNFGDCLVIWLLGLWVWVFGL